MKTYTRLTKLVAWTFACVAVVAAADGAPAQALAVAPCGSSGAEARDVADRAAVPLADALADWITLVEKDNAAAASSRWAADPEARDQMTRLWTDLRDRSGRYQYRNWLTGEAGVPSAANAGGGKDFTVGGHDFGHLHVNWAKTDQGWRFKSVFACR
jgi:hypothetical protein